LTKEKFSGVSKRPSGILSVSRDTLNPLLNTETLRNRLNVIESYKYMYGVEHAHYPHYAMQRFSKHFMRYKFNYAVKGFALYLMYRDISQFRKMNNQSYVTIYGEIIFGAQLGFHTAMFAGLCAFI
jgi:hypothetical protein